MASLPNGDPTALGSWAGALNDVARGRAETTLRNPVRKSGGGTGAFLGLANNGKQYWVKVPNNPQGTQVIVNEVVVAGVGDLLGAPVRPTALIAVPDTLQEWRIAPGIPLRGCVAHGSEHLAQAEENDSFEYRGRDDNRSRQAQLIALWDLCMGGDPQWLYDLGNEYSTWSFDHGLWLGGDGYWTRESLIASRDIEWPWEESVAGLDRTSFSAFAHQVEAITPEQVLTVLARVPVEWGTSNEDLETLGWFIYYRRAAAARRLRALGAHI